MKKILLLSPLLWIRKILLYTLGIAILLGLLVYFLANSPWVVKKAADAFAPDYNIGYSRIHGNVLTGVEIEDVTYATQPLAKHLTLKWNPNGLVQKKIIVNNLIIHDANIDTIKALIDTFSSEDNESSKAFDFSVNVKKLTIDTKSFVQDEVKIKDVKLDVRKVYYAKNRLSVTKMELNVTSNLSNLLFKGSIKDNQLVGKVNLLPQEELFRLYTLPIRKKAIGKVQIDLNLSKERVIAKIDANATQLLKAKEGEFNLDIEHLNSTLSYRFDDATLKADTYMRLNTPYGKGIVVTNLLTLDKKLTYHGEINLKQLIGIDAKLSKVLNNLNVSYKGDANSIDAKIDASMLKGDFNSNDFKTANLHLQSKEALHLSDYIALPPELNATKLNVTLDAPISFDANAPYHAVAKVRSNLVNIDANVSYTTHLALTSQIDIPKTSLLNAYSEDVKWEGFSPLHVVGSLKDDNVTMRLASKHLNTALHYDLNSTKVDAKADIVGVDVQLLGMVKKEIKISSKVTSISSLLQSMTEIYRLENLPKVEGSAMLEVTVDALERATIALKSPQINYHIDHQNIQVFDEIDMLLEVDKEKIVLERYQVIYAKEKIFASKPSIVTLKDNLITLSPLWVNDQLKSEGNYDLKTKKGSIVLKAQKLHIAHELIDFDSDVEVVTTREGNKTSVKGVVTLLGGEVHYDISKKNFASDSDIVIVQDMKESTESPFMDNLSIELQIKTKKHLLYNKDAIAMKANVDLSVHKAENSELLVLGSIEVLEGSTYIFQDKKFTLKKSFVHFTGNPNKPLLELKVLYKAIDYDITVKITGTADMPQIDFSSKPSLSQEQILSLILFDTVEGAGTNNGDEMMKMMGGAMAKSALNNIGIKLDHLVLGEGSSVEVGKKLTKNITIIYINGNVAQVKLKYEHGKHTQSVIGASEVSQSYDIIYKNDF